MARAKKLKVGTELTLVIPRTVRKNKSHRAVPSKKKGRKLSARVILSGDSRDFREFMRELCKEQGMPSKISYGKWAIEIITYWPELRHLDVDFPHGDVDAPITPVLDALQRGAILFDDDVRLGPLVADRGYDPDNPRIEVLLKRWA